MVSVDMIINYDFPHSDGDLLKRTIEIKRRLTDLMDRENKITYREDGDDSDSDDSDMEEVPPATESADDLLALALSTAKSDRCSVGNVS